MIIKTREKRVLKNIGLILIYQIVAIICGFIVPRVIIQEYGSSVNGLVNSILQFIGYIYLAEGGIGLAIKSLMYKPIAEKNKKEIAKILKTAKRFWRQILWVYIIYVMALCIIYPKIVAGSFERFFTIALIIAIAINRFSEYFMCMEYELYLQANQERYIIALASILAIILTTIVTIVLIKIECSIIIIKLVTSIIFIARGLFYKIYVIKKYKIKVSKEIKEVAVEQRKDGFAHQIAYIIHSNIDIVLITCFINTTEVSVYSVYLLVLKGIKSIVMAIMGAVDSVFGEIFAQKGYKEANQKFTIYEVIYFSIITILYDLCFILINPFVQIYTKGITDINYYRPLFAIIITSSEFVWAIRYPFEQLISVVGHFKQTKLFAYLEAVINLILSIILIRKLGIVGVAIGTLVAITVRAIYMIWYFSKNILERELKIDIKFVIVMILQTIIIVPVGSMICNKIQITTYFSWISIAIILGIIVVAIICITNLLLNKRIVKEAYKESIIK